MNEPLLIMALSDHGRMIRSASVMRGSRVLSCYSIVLGQLKEMTKEQFFVLCKSISLQSHSTRIKFEKYPF
jgi:hypothetical protein